MSDDRKKDVKQRVTVRLPEEQIKMINTMLSEGKYKTQSDFLRGAVELLLFFEDKIALSDITNIFLRGNMTGLLFKTTIAEQTYPKMKKDIELSITDLQSEIARITNEMNEFMLEHEKRINESKKEIVESKKELIHIMAYNIQIPDELSEIIKSKNSDLTENDKQILSLFKKLKNRAESLFNDFYKNTGILPEINLTEMAESLTDDLKIMEKKKKKKN